LRRQRARITQVAERGGGRLPDRRDPVLEHVEQRVKVPAAPQPAERQRGLRAHQRGGVARARLHGRGIRGSAEQPDQLNRSRALTVQIAD
jgi:hypothetical protein